MTCPGMTVIVTVWGYCQNGPKSLFTGKHSQTCNPPCNPKASASAHGIHNEVTIMPPSLTHGERPWASQHNSHNHRNQPQPVLCSFWKLPLLSPWVLLIKTACRNGDDIRFGLPIAIDSNPDWLKMSLLFFDVTAFDHINPAACHLRWRWKHSGVEI